METHHYLRAAAKATLLTLGIYAFQSMVPDASLSAPPPKDSKPTKAPPPQTAPMIQNSAGTTVRCTVGQVTAWVDHMPQIIMDRPAPPDQRHYGFMTITALSFDNTSDKPVTVSLQSVQIDAGKKKHTPEHTVFQHMNGKYSTSISLKPKEQASVELRAEGNNIPSPGKDKPVSVTITLLAGTEKLTLGGNTKLEETY